MAEWNKNKVDPINLHGGQEFSEGDNLAVDELNVIVNNSFYASEKATRAEELAESAVAGQGTPVTLNGEILPTWSADFAESERQKSKNLFNINSNYVSSGTLGINITDNMLKLSTSNAYGYIGYKVSVKPNTTYTLSRLLNIITSGSEDTGRIGVFKTSGNVYFEASSSENYITFTTGSETEITIYFYAVPYGTTATAEVEFINIQLEEDTVSTEWQAYNGAIVHEKDIKPILIYDIDEKQTPMGLDDAYSSGIKFNSGVNIPTSDFNYFNIYTKTKNNAKKKTTINKTTYYWGDSFLGFNEEWVLAQFGILFIIENNLLSLAEAGYTTIHSSVYANKNNSEDIVVYRIEGGY